MASLRLTLSDVRYENFARFWPQFVVRWPVHSAENDCGIQTAGWDDADRRMKMDGSGKIACENAISDIMLGPLGLAVS